MSTETNENFAEYSNGGEWIHDGPYGHLHLRDFFAAFALAGMLAQPNGNPLGSPHDVGLRWCAASAYALADAMLDQRRQSKD